MTTDKLDIAAARKRLANRNHPTGDLAAEGIAAQALDALEKANKWNRQYESWLGIANRETKACGLCPGGCCLMTPDAKICLRCDSRVKDERIVELETEKRARYENDTQYMRGGG